MNEKLEHPLDRKKRLGIDFVVKYDFEDGIGYRLKGLGHVYWMNNPVTKLNTCDLCGKTSTPKKVNYRNDVYRWNGQGKDDYSPSKSLLCMSCWNKVKPLVKREEEADEMKRFINHMKKEISNERKNQNDRANARLSGDDDGRGEERRP